MPLSETDTLAKLKDPELYRRGWTEEHIKRGGNCWNNSCYQWQRQKVQRSKGLHFERVKNFV